MKHEKKFEALVARTKALDAKIIKANAISASHQRAIDQLVADVRSYNNTTKRFDISVQRAVYIKRASDNPAQDRAQTPQGFDGQPIYYTHERKARMMGTGDKGCTCAACPPHGPYPKLGYFCWIDEHNSGCDLWCQTSVCVYTCIVVISLPV
jgi:hypothetical protein